MKNPLFDNFATLQEQSDTYALFIGEMMKPGANDKVIIQELEEQNEAIMNECDILQVKHDKLERLLKNNEEIAAVNDSLVIKLDAVQTRNHALMQRVHDLQELVRQQYCDVERSKYWRSWSTRFVVLTALTTVTLVLACLS